MFTSIITLSIARSALLKFAVPTLFFWLLVCGIIHAAASPEDEAKIDSLIEQLVQLKKGGKFAEAIPIAQESVELSETTFGPEHPGMAVSLGHLAILYDNMRDYAKAEPLYRRALEIYEKAQGPEHPNTAITLSNLADLYVNMGDYAKAESFHLRALEIREKARGSDHPDTARSLNDLARLYRNMANHAKAEPLQQRALKIQEKALGPNHTDTATSLNNLAELYRETGDYTKAEPLYQRALATFEEVRGPKHPDIATILNNLALLFASMGHRTKAEPLHQRALDINERALGPNHPATALSLHNLGLNYSEMGEYAKAEPLFLRALRIREEALGLNHPDTGSTLNALALLYDYMGAHAKAEPLFQRALEISEKALGPDHPDTATRLSNLSRLYQDMRDFAKAEPLCRRALKIREKKLGPEHPDTGGSLNNLAWLYRDMGDYAKAEPLYQRALKITEKAFGPEHPGTALVLSGLGGLYGNMREYAKAEPVYQRALEICEKALGPNHPNTATGVNNLAWLYLSIGDYAKAEPLCQRTLEIREKALGPEHPDTADSVNNLAGLYHSMGEYAKAEPLYERASQSRAATNLENLAWLKIDLGKAEDAIPLLTEVRQLEERTLSNILSFTSEEQRLAFQKKTRPFHLPGTLGHAGEIALTVLRRKGVVLDSLLEDRLVAEASNDPKKLETIERVRAAKQQLMQLILEVRKDLSETAQKKRGAERDRLSTEVEQLEAGLAREVAGLGKARRALSVTVEQVQSAIPTNGTLVELLRYNHYLGKNQWEFRYGAVVIVPAGKPKWVPLGSAAEIEKEISLYQKSARGKTDEATLSTILKALQERVWAPIEMALPAGATTVIVSPDADLSFISFATLLAPDDRFVGEKYQIRYVASGRDLLKETKPTADAKTSMRVFANPDFAAKGGTVASVTEKTTSVALRSIEMRDLQSMSLPSLPGTAKESAELQRRAMKTGWQLQAYLGPDATEAELRKVSSPRILHLATHGFFLPEVDLGKSNDAFLRSQDIPKGKLLNPMHRSGVAVASAQTTLQAWGKGEVPPTENDGVVTAEEVGGLKLNGTWLVVLSACDTGGGEAKAGEGVMGLRRGFIQAGAQNLLMTLWPINDAATVQIMLDFYDAAEKTKNAPQALADVQRDWLVKLRKERGLQAAVQLAGPFIMSSQGQP